MGFGPPGAIGAKLAAPDRTVVCLVGDGGFGQNPAMLSTAVELDLDIVWVVMNNNAYGTIAGLETTRPSPGPTAPMASGSRRRTNSSRSSRRPWTSMAPW
jgi:thiamine pyrophosphate-dependent acetolactate synthase large subunit-like protein